MEHKMETTIMGFMGYRIWDIWRMPCPLARRLALMTCHAQGHKLLSSATGGDLGTVLGFYWGCIGIMENKMETII